MSEKKEVVVTDIKMSFDAMITFIIKWFFATIIAGLIIFVMIGVIAFVLSLMGIVLPFFNIL